MPKRMFIYFIQDHEGNIKVGVARDPHKRLPILQVANAHRLTLLMTIETRDPFSEEQRLHALFAKPPHRRLRGEWFAIDRDTDDWRDCGDRAVVGG